MDDRKEYERGGVEGKTKGEFVFMILFLDPAEQKTSAMRRDVLT